METVAVNLIEVASDIRVYYNASLDKILAPYNRVARGISESAFPPRLGVKDFSRTGLVSFDADLTVEEARLSVKLLGLPHLHFRETLAMCDNKSIQVDLPISIDVIDDSVEVDGIRLIPRVYIGFGRREIQLPTENGSGHDHGVHYPVIIPRSFNFNALI